MTATPTLKGLTAGALFVALAALIAGVKEADPGSRTDLRQLARTIDAEEDHLTVAEVEARLTTGGGLQVIDLRDSVSYAAAHIPGAIHATVADVLDLHLRPDQPVLLYSLGGIHAAQAWMLLKAAGADQVFTLRGGWHAWEEAHMAPVPAETPTRKKPAREIKEDEKLPWEC